MEILRVSFGRSGDPVAVDLVHDIADAYDPCENQTVIRRDHSDFAIYYNTGNYVNTTTDETVASGHTLSVVQVGHRL